MQEHVGKESCPKQGDGGSQRIDLWPESHSRDTLDQLNWSVVLACSPEELDRADSLRDLGGSVPNRTTSDPPPPPISFPNLVIIH